MNPTAVMPNPLKRVPWWANAFSTRFGYQPPIHSAAVHDRMDGIGHPASDESDACYGKPVETGSVRGERVFNAFWVAAANSFGG